MELERSELTDICSPSQSIVGNVGNMFLTKKKHMWNKKIKDISGSAAAIWILFFLNCQSVRQCCWIVEIYQDVAHRPFEAQFLGCILMAGCTYCVSFWIKASAK